MYKKYLFKHSDYYYGVLNMSQMQCAIVKTKKIEKAIQHKEDDVVKVLSILKLREIIPEKIEVKVNEFGEIIWVSNQSP